LIVGEALVWVEGSGVAGKDKVDGIRDIVVGNDDVDVDAEGNA